MRVAGTSIRATARKRYRESEVYWDWAVSEIREPRIRSCFFIFYIRYGVDMYPPHNHSVSVSVPIRDVASPSNIHSCYVDDSCLLGFGLELCP